MQDLKPLNHKPTIIMLGSSKGKQTLSFVTALYYKFMFS